MNVSFDELMLGCPIVGFAPFDVNRASGLVPWARTTVCQKWEKR